MQFTSDLCLMNLDGGAEEKRKTEKMTSAFELKSSFLTTIIKKKCWGGVYPLMIACKQFGFSRWTDGGQLAVLVFFRRTRRTAADCKDKPRLPLWSAGSEVSSLLALVLLAGAGHGNKRQPHGIPPPVFAGRFGRNIKKQVACLRACACVARW